MLILICIPFFSRAIPMDFSKARKKPNPLSPQIAVPPEHASRSRPEYDARDRIERRKSDWKKKDRWIDREQQLKKKKNGKKGEEEKSEKKIHAHAISRVSAGCGVRGGGTGTVGGPLFAYVARGGGGRRAGRQALMPMHHAYSNLLPPPPWHGTAVHGS